MSKLKGLENMTVFLSAKLQNYESFVNIYKESDLNLYDNGSPLIFYAMSNNNPEERFRIVNFLIEHNVNLKCENSNNETLFHILLSRKNHNLTETLILFKKLDSIGIDINQLDNKNRSAIQWLINMGYTDKELEPFYDIIFSKSKLLLSHKNNWGYSPIDLVQKLPYREELYKRMIEYDKKQ